MYSNTGYLNHSDIEIEDNIHPLIIGSCGIYRMLTVPALRTTRPQGRRDYQLLYVFGGTAVFQKCGRLYSRRATGLRILRFPQNRSLLGAFFRKRGSGPSAPGRF